MSPAFDHFSQLIAQLGQRAGLALRLQDGACALTDRHGAYWQLSLGRNSELMAIEGDLGLLSLWPDDTARRLLEFNTRHALLRGATLGVAPDSGEIRLTLLLPVARTDAVQLENSLVNLMAVRASLLEALTGEGAPAAEPIAGLAFQLGFYV